MKHQQQYLVRGRHSNQTANMHTNKGSRTQRYRPASEFDDATLARKRDYWRTKKREQRAKLSVVKKKFRVASTRMRDSTLTVSAQVSPDSVVLSSLLMPHAVSGPTLLNSDGSYQIDVGNTPVSSASVLLRPENADTEAMVNQKERWFQRIKLNKVLPPFPGVCSSSQKGVVVCTKVIRSSPTGIVSGAHTTARPNGALNTDSPVPPVHIKVYTGSTVHQETHSRMSVLNGNSPEMFSQHLASQGIPGHNDHNKPKVRIHVPPRPMPPDVTTGLRVKMNQCAPGNGGANTRGKTRAFVPEPSTAPRGSPAVPETEEEKAAKRRENWRIKKREQRAKRAAKLVKDRERTQSLERSVQRGGQPSCMISERPFSARNREGQRETVTRARAPFMSAGRPPTNDRALAVSCSTSIGVKKKSDHSPRPKQTTIHPNQQSVFVKEEDPQETKVIAQPSTAASVIGHKLDLEPSIKPLATGIPLQFSNVSRGIVRSKTQRQRFLETQRMFSQKNAKKSLSPAVGLLPGNALIEGPVETAEERAARKREYWRVKKREQRSKLSVEVKARMKERDALMRRVKRYQSILEEMRRARAGHQKVPTPTGNTVTNASETIGGFIKEDGTVTITIPASSGKQAEINSLSSTLHPITSCNVSTDKISANVSSRVRVNPPLPLQRGAQVKSSYYPAALSVAKSQKIVTIRPRSASNSSPKTLTNSHMNVNRSHISLSPNVRSTISTLHLTGPKLASCAGREVSRVSADSSPAVELTEEARVARRREYWRIKKREQRANRAGRLRQSLSRGKINAVKQRRQNQRPTPARCVAVPPPGVNTSVDNTVSDTSLSTPSMVSPTVGIIKQEQELSSTEAMCPLSEQHLCKDIKAPPSPLPEPQSELDPSVSTDSQTTTLMAVASMKKLLEESLSTVADCNNLPQCKSEPLPCKTETEPCSPDGVTELDVKPKLPSLTQGAESDVSGSSAPTLEVKPWQVQDCAMTPSTCPSPPCPLSPNADNSVLSTQPLSLPPSCAEIDFALASSTDSPFLTQAPSCSNTPSSPLPRRAQRLCAKRAGHQHYCSPVPQKQQPPEQQPCPNVPGESSILQKKREYWKLMKRQQRARKARERQGIRAPQAPNLVGKALRPMHSSGGGSSLASASLSTDTSTRLQPQPHPASRNHAYLTAVTTLPTLLVVSPTPTTTRQPLDALPLRPPPNNLSGAKQSDQPVCVGVEGAHNESSSCSSTPQPAGREVVTPPGGRQGEVVLSGGSDGRLLLLESQQEGAPSPSPQSPPVRRWKLQVQASTTTPPTATLTPSTSQQPPISNQTLRQKHTYSPAKCLSSPTLRSNALLPTKREDPQSPLKPPKATQIPLEDEGDILRKKREYWRVKKKEQRARKAARDRELGHLKASTHLRPILPAKTLSQSLESQGQDSSHWFNSSEDTALLLRYQMAKSNAERQREYRARRNVDPQRREEYLRKERERWKRDAEAGKKKSVNDLSERAKRHKRKIWRKAKERQKRKAEINNSGPTPPTPPHSPDSDSPDSDNQDAVQARPGSSSTQTETELNYLPEQCHTGSMKDEAEMGFAHDDEDSAAGGPVSEATWRNRYLMDYDPLNQLLVCMVCGEQQYSHSLEGARGHIEEAHPDTLSLEPRDHQHILETWDEQVSVRERFFTSQLQHQSGAALPGESTDHPAEVEVMVDMEDSTLLKNSKSQTKNPKKL